MSMTIKSVTISSHVGVTHSTNGIETGKTIYSEPGLRADLMLFSNEEWKTRGKPSTAQLSVSFDIESPPNLAPSELRGWIRDQLIEMRQDNRPAADA